jgi:GntR family transcriptional regulator, transcriptional repressor for pyruvate dehydrogenase complex
MSIVDVNQVNNAAASRRRAAADKVLAVERVRPAYAQVADQLRELIVRGDLLPGGRLPVESELSALFGVSRSTIREALRTLSSQSLVRTKRGVNGGTFVEAPDAESMGSYLETTLGLLSGADILTVDEMLEARELFEIPATRLAARRRTAEQLEALRSTLAEPQDVERAHNFEGNKDFHIMIVRSTGNRLFETMTSPVFSVLRTRFLRDRAPRRFWGSVADDHRQIFEAIEVQDEDAAAAHMQEHLVRLRATYERIDRRSPQRP